MADHDDPEQKRWVAAAEGVIDCLLTLKVMLGALPIPIEIALSEDDPGASVPSLVRAGTLLAEEPIPELAAALIRTVILEWLTSYDQVALINQAGFGPWRLEGLEMTIRRMAYGLAAADAELRSES